jgi:hypothetical protein
MGIAASQQSNRTIVRKALRLLLKSAIGVFVIAIALVATLLLAMWREHKIAITLPLPTGNFAIGRTTFAWTDEAAFPNRGSRPVRPLFALLLNPNHARLHNMVFRLTRYGFALDDGNEWIPNEPLQRSSACSASSRYRTPEH